MVGQNMRMAKDKGAEAVLTPCPLCHLALDGYQADSAARWGRTDLPTFHLPQLVGLALGVDASKLGLNKHISRPASCCKRTIWPRRTSPSEGYFPAARRSSLKPPQKMSAAAATMRIIKIMGTVNDTKSLLSTSVRFSRGRAP